MPQVTCPDQETLHQLLQGTLPGVTAKQLEEHLFDCDHCLQTVDTLVDEDPLFLALRGGPTVQGDEEIVARIIERARQLHSQAETVQSQETLLLGQEQEILSHSEADNDGDLADDEQIDFLHPPRRKRMKSAGWAGTAF
ncbi:MAG: zf-HC2 domain-containing protein [Planctomycetaceae bacterium]|nr:zf-HC2 domain-containing protein [Planctomycetaceae bacterium]